MCCENIFEFEFECQDKITLKPKIELRTIKITSGKQNNRKLKQNNGKAERLR